MATTTNWMRQFLLAMIVLVGLPLGVQAGQGMGENSIYAREMGKSQLLFYVAAGNGVGQVEYICEADAGTLSSVLRWRIKKFVYNSSHILTTIQWADGTDDYSKSCDLRTSYDYTPDS